MSSLYTLAEESLEISRILEETAGELTPELEQRLDELMSGSEAKLESAAHVVRMLENQAHECGEEIIRLEDRAKSFFRQAEALKQRMQFVVDSLYSGKLKTAKWTLYTQKSPDTVYFQQRDGTDLVALLAERPELVRVKMELNKTALRESYDRAEELPPEIMALPSPGRRSLRIR